MQQKETLENFLKRLFIVYKEKNMNYFFDECYKYNIDIRKYKKDISSLTKKVFDNILNILPESKARFSYKEFNYFYKINLEFTKYNSPTPDITMDIPVFDDNLEKISNILVKFIIDNKINSTIKINKIYKNSILEINVSEINNAKRIVNLFAENEDLKKEIYSRVIPFLPQINLIGFYCEYKPIDFKNFYIKNIYAFLSTVQTEEDITLENLKSYIHHLYKREINLNIKRNLKLIKTMLNIIMNNEDLFSMYNYNSDMNISSFNSNDYQIKLNGNLLEFITKSDKTETKYGDDNYLNIAYSKFYEAFVKKDGSEVYYSYFYSIYNKLIMDRYKNIEIIKNMGSPTKDAINNSLIVLSSLFFAQVKMGYSLKDIYYILDKLYNN